MCERWRNRVHVREMDCACKPTLHFCLPNPPILLCSGIVRLLPRGHNVVQGQELYCSSLSAAGICHFLSTIVCQSLLWGGEQFAVWQSCQGGAAAAPTRHFVQRMPCPLCLCHLLLWPCQLMRCCACPFYTCNVCTSCLGPAHGDGQLLAVLRCAARLHSLSPSCRLLPCWSHAFCMSAQEWARNVTSGKLSKGDRLGVVDHSKVGG